MANERYLADLTPRKFAPPAVPAWQGKYTFGVTGNFFSVISLKLLRPTPQYPDTKLTIQLQSGSGRAFGSITPGELKELAELLLKLANEVEPLYNNFKTQADTMNRMMAMVQGQMENLGRTGEVPGFLNDGAAEMPPYPPSR